MYQKSAFILKTKTSKTGIALQYIVLASLDIRLFTALVFSALPTNTVHASHTIHHHNDGLVMRAWA